MAALEKLIGASGRLELVGHAKNGALAFSGVKVTGDRSLEVTLSQQDPIFALKLANHIAPIIKAAIAPI